MVLDKFYDIRRVTTVIRQNVALQFWIFSSTVLDSIGFVGLKTLKNEPKVSNLSLKTTLESRPVYHRLEDRIRAHVTLCWLALLLIRLAENNADDSWRSIIRRHLELIHLGEFRGAHGQVWQATELSSIQKGYFTALKLEEPPRFISITTRDSKNDV